MKCSVYIATSLDGYIARSDGSLDWLPGASGEAVAEVDPNEDFGYGAFMASVDHLLMGRHTYEAVRGFGQWPYQVPVTVWSRTLSQFPQKGEEAPAQVAFSAHPIQQLVTELAQQGVQHLYVDGGQTIRHFLAEGLIGEITLSVVPVILGEGISLFSGVKKEVHLELLQSRPFANGMVQNHYRVLS